jgi:hypothetical protein
MSTKSEYMLFVLRRIRPILLLQLVLLGIAIKLAAAARFTRSAKMTSYEFPANWRSSLKYWWANPKTADALAEEALVKRGLDSDSIPLVHESQVATASGKLALSGGCCRRDAESTVEAKSLSSRICRSMDMAMTSAGSYTP